MLSTALLILPDFALMLLGLVLAHRLGFDRGFWNGAEKLVYYVLFPPLLFNAIVHSEFSIGGEVRLLAVALGAFGLTAAVVSSPIRCCVRQATYSRAACRRRFATTRTSGLRSASRCSAPGASR